MRLPRQFSQRARKTFYFIHLWTGLILGLWFVMVGLTGTVLAWRSEFTSFETRTRVGAPNLGANEKTIPVSRAIALFKAAQPQLKPERELYIPSPKIEFRYYRVNGSGKVDGKRVSMIYLLNPITGQVYSPVQRSALWVDTFEKLHADLILGAKGTLANGVFSLFSVFMLLSGLWLWWPSNWKQFKLRVAIKRGVSLRRTLYDLHNVFGAYLFGLLLLLSITAVVLVFEDQTDDSISKQVNALTRTQVTPKPPRIRLSMGGGLLPIIGPQGQMLTVDELVEKAKVAEPNRTLVKIKLPQNSNQPFQASFDPIGFNNGTVLFDPYTGQKINTYSRPAATGDFAMKVVGNLHYGWFGGFWSQFLYGLSGFLPLSLFITGLWMWLNKKRSQKRLQAKRSSSATSAKTSMEGATSP